MPDNYITCNINIALYENHALIRDITAENSNIALKQDPGMNEKWDDIQQNDNK